MSGFSFTKLFSSITESTVWAEPDHVRIMWITMLAMADRQGRIFSSIPGLAGRARVTVEQAEEALDKFLSPDKYSRTKKYEGRRITLIDGGWALLNYEKYRELRDNESDKERKREWARKHRAEIRLSASTIDQGRPESTQAEAEAEAEEETEGAPRKRGTHTPFRPPTLEELQAECAAKGYTFNPKKFHAFYSSKGWMVGKNKMKDWKQAALGWQEKEMPTKPPDLSKYRPMRRSEDAE